MEKSCQSMRLLSYASVCVLESPSRITEWFGLEKTSIWFHWDSGILPYPKEELESPWGTAMACQRAQQYSSGPPLAQTALVRAPCDEAEVFMSLPSTPKMAEGNTCIPPLRPTVPKSSTCAMLPTCSFIFAPQTLLGIITGFFCGKGQL